MKRALLLVFVLVACDQGAKKSAGTGSTAGSGSARTVPAGPYVVRFDCVHSNQPFGPGTQVRNAAWDLGAKQLSVLAYEESGEPAEADATERTPVVTPLSSDKVAQIEAAVVAVLRGGPDKPAHPQPRGTPCPLGLRAAGPEVVKLEKAEAQIDDAATDLVKTLNGP